MSAVDKEWKEFETIVNLFAKGKIDDTYSIILQYYGDGHLYYDCWKHVNWKIDTILSLIQIVQQYEQSHIEVYFKAIWLIHQILSHNRSSILPEDFTIAIQEELVSILICGSMLYKNYGMSLELLNLLIKRYEFPLQHIYLIGYRMVSSLPSIIYEHNFIAILKFTNNLFLQSLPSHEELFHSNMTANLNNVTGYDGRKDRPLSEKYHRALLSSSHGTSLLSLYIIMLEFLVSLYCGVNDDSDGNYFLTNCIAMFSFGNHLLSCPRNLSTQASVLTISFLRQLVTKQIKNVYALVVHHYQSREDKEEERPPQQRSLLDTWIVTLYQCQELESLPLPDQDNTSSSPSITSRRVNYVLQREILKLLMLCCREELVLQDCLVRYFTPSQCRYLLTLYTTTITTTTTTTKAVVGDDGSLDSSSSLESLSAQQTQRQQQHQQEEFLLYDTLLEWYLMLYLTDFPFHNEQHHHMFLPLNDHQSNVSTRFTATSSSSSSSSSSQEAKETVHITFILTLWKAYTSHLKLFPFYPLSTSSESFPQEEEEKVEKAKGSKTRFLESLFRFCSILESTFQLCSDLTHGLVCLMKETPKVSKAPRQTTGSTTTIGTTTTTVTKWQYEILSLKYELFQLLIVPYFTVPVGTTTTPLTTAAQMGTNGTTGTPDQASQQQQQSISPLEWDLTYHYVLDLMMLFFVGVEKCWQSPFLPLDRRLANVGSGVGGNNPTATASALGNHKGGLKGEVDRDYNLIHLPQYYLQQFIDITNLRIFDDPPVPAAVPPTPNPTPASSAKLSTQPLKRRKPPVFPMTGVVSHTSTSISTGVVTSTGTVSGGVDYAVLSKALETAWYDLWMILLHSLFVHFSLLQDFVLNWDLPPKTGSGGGDGTDPMASKASSGSVAHLEHRHRLLCYFYAIVTILFPQFHQATSFSAVLHQATAGTTSRSVPSSLLTLLAASVKDFGKIYNLLYQYYLHITHLQPQAYQTPSWETPRGTPRMLSRKISGTGGTGSAVTSERMDREDDHLRASCFGMDRKILQILTILFTASGASSSSSTHASAPSSTSRHHHPHQTPNVTAMSCFHFHFPLSEHLYYQLLLPSYLRHQVLPIAASPATVPLAVKLFDGITTATATQQDVEDADNTHEKDLFENSFQYLHSCYQHFHTLYNAPVSSSNGVSGGGGGGSNSIPQSPYGMHNFSQTGNIPEGIIRRYYYTIPVSRHSLVLDGAYVEGQTALLSCFLALLSLDANLVRKYVNKYPMLMQNWQYYAPITTPVSASIGFTATGLSLRPLMQCQRLFEKTMNKLEIFFEKPLVEYLLRLMAPYQVNHNHWPFEQLRSYQASMKELSRKKKAKHADVSAEVKIFLGEWIYHLGNEHPGLIYRGISRPEIEEQLFAWLKEELHIPTALSASSPSSRDLTQPQLQLQLLPTEGKEGVAKLGEEADVVEYHYPAIILSCLKGLCMIAHNINPKPMYQTSPRLAHYSIYYQHQSSSYAHRTLLHPRSVHYFLAILNYTYFPPSSSSSSSSSTKAFALRLCQQKELLSYRLIYLHYLFQWSNAILSTLLDSLITPITRQDITQITQLKDQLLHHMIPFIPVMMEYIITTKRHPRPLGDLAEDGDEDGRRVCVHPKPSVTLESQPSSGGGRSASVRRVMDDELQVAWKTYIDEDEIVVELDQEEEKGGAGSQPRETEVATSTTAPRPVDLKKVTSVETNCTDTSGDAPHFVSVKSIAMEEEDEEEEEGLVPEDENDDDDMSEDTKAQQAAIQANLEEVAEYWQSRWYSLSDVLLIDIFSADHAPSPAEGEGGREVSEDMVEDFPWKEAMIHIQYLHAVATSSTTTTTSTTTNPVTGGGEETNPAVNLYILPSHLDQSGSHSHEATPSVAVAGTERHIMCPAVPCLAPRDHPIDYRRGRGTNYSVDTTPDLDFSSYPSSRHESSSHSHSPTPSRHSLVSLQSVHELLLLNTFYTQQVQLANDSHHHHHHHHHHSQALVVSARESIDTSTSQKIGHNNNQDEDEEEEVSEELVHLMDSVLPTPHSQRPRNNTTTSTVSSSFITPSTSLPLVSSSSTTSPLQQFHYSYALHTLARHTPHHPWCLAHSHETAVHSVLESFAETLFASIYYYFCTDNIFPLSNYLQYKSVFQQIPLITSLSYFMICYKKNLIILRKGLEIIGHFAFHELNLSSIAMHSPLGLYYVMKSSLGNVVEVQLHFVMIIYAMILPNSNNNNSNNSGATNTPTNANTISGPGMSPSRANKASASSGGAASPSPATAATTSSTLLMGVVPASNLLLNEANEFAKDNFFRFELHEYMIAIFGSLVTIYAPPPPSVTPSALLHQSLKADPLPPPSTSSSRRKSSTTVSDMMITHVGSSGNTWYTSTQLEMISYVLLVMVSLATNDVNILQLCQKTAFVIQLIQWLDITTPLTIPSASGSTTSTTSSAASATSSHHTTGGTNLTTSQLCAIYLKLHYLALKFITSIDSFVPELIESSEYKTYILTIVKKSKKSITQLLKFYSQQSTAGSCSAAGSGGSGSNGMNGGGMGGNHSASGHVNSQQTYKGLIHQRYLYLLDQISLSTIEDFVNDERITMLKDNCIIS